MTRILVRALSCVWRYGAPAVAFLLTLVLWETIVRVTDLPTYVLPTPSLIAQRLWAERAILLSNTFYTMVEAVCGFTLGAGLAFLAATAFVHSTLLEQTFYPWAIVLETVPVIAIAPLLTLWLGFGMGPKVVIAAIVCFFPVLVNTVRGLRAVDPRALELFRLLSATRWDIFRLLRFPSALSYLFASLKVSSTLSVIGAVVGEFTGADRGIGYMVVSAGYRMDTPQLFAAIVFSSAAGIAFFYIIALIERLCLRWPGALAEG
ncbi:MAG: ABC transporter permease [Bacillota bacterium]